MSRVLNQPTSTRVTPASVAAAGPPPHAAARGEHGLGMPPLCARHTATEACRPQTHGPLTDVKRKARHIRTGFQHPIQGTLTPGMQEADEQLMLRYRDGDTRSFEVLYERHKGPLYRYLVRQCGIASIAEELFQDIWMNLIRARARYEAKAKFTTYLYRLAHNRLIDHYRKQRNGIPRSYDDGEDGLAHAAADPLCNPEHQAGVQEQFDRLLEVLRQLPEAQREAFVLREEGGFSVEQIAEITGVGAETAKSRLRYAVAKLRQGLRGER